MAASTIPFFTGKKISHEDPVAIAPGTAVASLTATEAASKYRTWALLAAASPAFLPHNWYRAEVTVDNVSSSEDAVVSQNSITICTVPSGARLELLSVYSQLGGEAFTITMAGTTADPCIVSERSYN